MQQPMYRLDERAAVEVMGWQRGGPDDDYWVLPDPQPGHASTIRMTQVGWRPTTEPFCLELLVQVLRERGLEVRIVETVESARAGWRCSIIAPDGTEALAVSAPTRGLAVVCAALALGPRQPVGGSRG